MRASRIFALARTIRWATVGGFVRNARAISSVVRPQTSRSVIATWASGGKAGWQQVKISRSRSSSTLPSSHCSASLVLDSSCFGSSVNDASKRARRRMPSMALKRPVDTSHARGLTGTPFRDHCWTATAKASCSASSAASKSPSKRINVARTWRDSERYTASTRSLTRSESRQVLATLIRLLGDFDAAEEALHDAFAVAVEQWSRNGVPVNPRAWLVSTGRFKAIDGMRRRARLDASLTELPKQLESRTSDAEQWDDGSVEDDRLRLIFTCCHPALPPEAQVAMTLREVCGLTTDEIARAFLTKPPTIAQRIVRAKAKIRDARIPYAVPSKTDLPDRLDAVLRVVYLVFNEGYSASSGGSLTRHDISGEAIRLGRVLIELLPEPEAVGLLALMLLQDSRRAARTSSTGDLILLEDQDRSLWNRDQIAEGTSQVERALSSRRFGPYTLQAAIAAVHAQAPSAAATDWVQIVGLYDVLSQADPSPVVELNRAAAVAMRDGPSAGLTLIDAILARGDLGNYHLAHAARADLCRRLGRTAEARTSYERALSLTQQEPERRFLGRRLAALSDKTS